MTGTVPAGGAYAARIPEKRPFAATRLAWFLWALCSVLVASSLLLDFLTPNYFMPQERPVPVLVAVADLLALTCAAVGVLIASRLPVNPVGWIFCGIGLLYGMRRLATAYADQALLAQPGLPWGEYAAWTSTWLRFSGLFALAALAVLLFPTGRPISPRWRVAVWAAIGGAVFSAFGDALRFGPLPAYYYVHNPVGLQGSVLPEVSSVVGGALLSASCLAAVASLALRLRRAGGDGRRRLGWVAYAAFPALVLSTVILLDWTVERFALLFLDQRAVWPVLRMVGSFGLFVKDGVPPGRLLELSLDLLLESLAVLAVFLVPVYTVVAVLRHRLYDADPAVDDALRGVTAGISALRWRRILLAGTVVGILPVVFIYLAIYVFVVFYPAFGQGEAVDQQRLDAVAAFVSGWGVRVFFVAITILAASWVARAASERATLHGVLVGLVAVAVNEAIISLFDRLVMLDELPVYLALGVSGGYLGGLAGRTNLSGEVYEASRQIGRAEDAYAVASAVGEHLGGPGVHGISLWRFASEEGDREFVLWGSWTPHGGEIWPPGARFDPTRIPALARLPERPWVLIRTGDLPAAEGVAWERSGIRSTLLIPLFAPSGAWRGLLATTFRSGRRPSRSAVRAYLTVAAQAALALENLRLVEEARRAGQQTGVLVERQRLAREIHDTLAQGFTSIVTNLTAAQMSQQRAGAARHLEEARRTARESLTEARRLVWALRPEALDRHSLSEALERLAAEWSEETGVEARAGTTGAPRPLLPEVEVALLRAAQEALANVRKHSRAARVNVTLSYVGDRIFLDVLDDGVGFDPARLKRRLEAHDEGGFGLTAMRERVEQLGGTLRVESAPGEGTTLVVELPVAPDGARTTPSGEGP